MREGKTTDFLLGEISGKLDLVLKGQSETNARIDKIDGRVRAVEVDQAKTGAKYGALGGTIVSIGIGLCIEMLKRAGG